MGLAAGRSDILGKLAPRARHGKSDDQRLIWGRPASSGGRVESGVVILLTGASGTVGRALLPLLLSAGHDVRALARDPRGLGRHRVDVQIALGDLARLGDRHLQRQALRGVDTVIHLAAAIRDEPHARVEELNGLATARLLRAAERAGVERFVFFSALGPPNSSGRASSGRRRLPRRPWRSRRWRRPSSPPRSSTTRATAGYG